MPHVVWTGKFHREEGLSSLKVDPLLLGVVKNIQVERTSVFRESCPILF